MGNTFRKVLSAILLIALFVIGGLLFRSTRGIPGVGGLLLRQGLVLFALIYLALWLFRRFRPKM